MSEDVRLSGYVRGLFAPEDEILETLRYELPRRGLPEIQISAEQGRLLQVLLTAVAAERVLEVGTLGGYSAIWMARALPAGGRLVSLEIDPERAAFAREFMDRAGVGDRVEVRIGEASGIMAALEGAAPFDAVFIDADKERYPAYLDLALRLLRPGGLVMADNAFWSGRVLDDDAEEEGTRAVREFNRRMAGHPDLVGTIVPVRDGLAVAVYRPAS
ncbi:MAG TPA: O-methyltransferase [Longimicrobiales bacterium]|nr:O-methyltransferase [Longimicrobiales bacterium]